MNKTDDVLLLATARDILMRDEAELMPTSSATSEQRIKLLETFDHLIRREIAELPEGILPTLPAQTDPAKQRARDYLMSVDPNYSDRAATTDNAYEKLKATFNERSKLIEAAGILWFIKSTETISSIDKNTVEEVFNYIYGRTQYVLQSPEVRTLIEEVRTQKDTLPPDDQRNFALMERDWTLADSLPKELIEEWIKSTSESNNAWVKARTENNFNGWLPHFEKVFDLARKRAEHLARSQETTPYQALLEEHNPGLRNETVTRIFGEIAERLPFLTRKVVAKQADDSVLPLPETTPEQQQWIVAKILEKMGFNSSNSVLALSEHPFSLGEYDDVRMTVGKHSSDLLSVLMDVIHEAGHCLYNANQPKEHAGQPIGRYQGTWVHETQSLFWEMQIVRSPEFAELIANTIKEELNLEGPQWSADNLYKLMTRVKPSLIRINADEVTYPAHVILRHNLEQQLLEGSLAPKDVPAAWNKAMKDLLNVDVPDYAQGCMQDIHWSDGTIGYFPAYTLGALGAAQLMEKAREDMPDINENIRTGNFAPITTWLSDNIHRHGSKLDGEALFEQVTGKPLSAEAWLKHIEERYIKGRWLQRAERKDIPLE